MPPGAAPAAPATPPATPPGLAGLLETARNKYGFDLTSKYKTDEDALQGLLNAARMVGRRNEEAELGRYFQQYRDQFEQFLAAQQGAQIQSPQQDQQDQDWWQPPEWQDAWNRFVVHDADGNPTLAENTPLEVRQAVEKREMYLRQWQYNLLHKPKEALKGLAEEIRREIRSEYSDYLESRREADRRQVEAQSILQEYGSWIYQTTPDGKMVMDLTTGRPAMTREGQLFTAHLVALQQQGLTDQKAMAEIARDRMFAQLMREQMANKPNPPAGTPAAGAPAPAGAAAGAARPGGAQLSNGRQPQAGGQPGQPKPRKGMSLREKLLAGAKDAPESDFAVQ